MFHSPKKQGKGANKGVPKDPPSFTTVAKCYTHDNTSSDAFILECYLLHVPDEARWVDTKNKKSNTTESTPVLTVVVADRSGPVTMDLWRDAAQDLLREVEQWKTQGCEPFCIEVSHFWLRGDTRNKWVTPVVKLVNSSRTQFKLIQRPTQASITDESTPASEGLYIKDFTLLADKPPFRASVAGIVQKTEAESESQGGTPMQQFKLHDTTGRYVTCMAFGRHAGSECIADGNEVILYFSTATAGLANKPGALWLYDEAHVVLLRQNCTPPPAKTFVDLQ